MFNIPLSLCIILSLVTLLMTPPFHSLEKISQETRKDYLKESRLRKMREFRKESFKGSRQESPKESQKKFLKKTRKKCPKNPERYPSRNL